MSLVAQPFDSFVVLDFEATCNPGPAPSPQEVIEYPSVLLCGETFEIVDEFRSFVRPQHHPELSDFCTELTSITQGQVDGAPSFPVVFERHVEWLRSHGLRVSADDDGASFAFIICGDWDFRVMLPAQCAACDPRIEFIPHAFRQWINLKKPFAELHAIAKAPGMSGMLRRLGLELTGHHHRGIDDCRNIGKIAARLAESGVTLSTTTTLPESRFPPLTLRLRFQGDVHEVSLDRRSLKSLYRIGERLFQRSFTRAVCPDGRELADDSALLDLPSGTKLTLK